MKGKQNKRKHPSIVMTPPGKKWVKCMYPPCPNKILVDEKPPGQLVVAKPQDKGSIPFCPKHLELLSFMMWLLPQVKIERQTTPSGVVLPGHKAFQMNPLEAPKP